jgi:squalene-associated FAD-dependent desaturase
MQGLGVLHRAAALRAGLLLRSEIERPDDNETCDAWLRRLGQTQAVRNAFWEPLIWAVLNDDPLVASAAMLIAVLDRAFMGTRDASRLGVPRRPLSRLYVDHAVPWLRARDCEVRFASPVRAIELRDDKVSGVLLKSGERIDTDRIVTAVPPHALVDLLPESLQRHIVFRDVARLQTSPIVNLWVLLERPLFDSEPFLGLIGSPFHWLFDRDQIEGRPPGDGTLVSVTISGARGFIEDDADALRELFVSEMKRFFPERDPKILGFRAVKEKRATISHAAGTYQRRPEARSPVAGLYLAGDWVRTGLPATIESAVQSGHEAARLVLADSPAS